MSATDADKTADITYNLNSEYFTIDTATGLVTTQGAVLDREATPTITVRVAAQDGQYTAYADVLITVLDTNDNSPTFGQTVYRITIGPGTLEGLSILAVTATDLDDAQNAYLTYWITGTDGKFAINAGNGEIMVVGSLNEGTKDHYEMKVFAKDHGLPPLVANVSVIITINDSNAHQPVFQEFVYDVNVTENSPVGSIVVNVTATDLDEGPAGQVTLKITAGNENNMFEIDGQTGVIRLHFQPDFEVTENYELQITAYDQGESPRVSTAVVHISVIDENDNAPVFLSLPEIIILEGPVSVNTQIIQIAAVDADSSLDNNNHVTYSITSETDKFQINPSVGMINSSDTISIGTYTLQVAAQDGGSPHLVSQTIITVQVLDSIDAAQYPQFSQSTYSVNVLESVVVPTDILDIDADGRLGGDDNGIYYNITSGNIDQHFSIQANNVCRRCLKVRVSMITTT